jgi:CHAT domain-containing protein/tetratricopeptide (TPR) repeat protein
MSCRKYDKTLICHLTKQVLKGKLTLAEALEQVATESILAQIDDKVIHELNRCSYAWGRRNPPQATILAKLTCRVAELKGSNAMRGDCNSTLGWLYLKQDKLDLALDCYKKALKFLGPIPRGQAGVARVRLEVGEIRMRQGDPAAAIAEYEAALALAQQLKRPYLESDAQNHLGTVYLALGQADLAMAAFQEALQVSQNSQDQHGEAAALGNLGRAYRFLGRLDEAISNHQKALTLSRTLNHQASTGQHLGQLGSALMEKGKLDEADARFQEALDIARECHDPPSEQQRLGSLGNLYQARAKQETDQLQSERWLTKAQQYHQDALVIARERKDRRSQARYLLSQGNVYRKLARFEKAQECYSEALCVTWEQDASDTQWRVHYALGNLYVAQHQYTQAFDHYTSAIDIIERQRDWLKIDSRIRFWQERATLYKCTVSCCLSMEDPEKIWPALVHTEQAKARYLADLLAERTSERPGTQQHLQTAFEPIEDTRKIIEAAIKGLSTSVAVVIFSVTELGTGVFIVTDQSKGKAILPGADWKRSADGRVRARLIEGFSQDTLQNLLITVDDSGRAIGGYLVDYYTDRGRWRESTLKSTRIKIYETLLACVHRELARLSVKQVIFMPNLGLSLLPLHACRTRQGYLLDHYEITYIPSFSMLRHCQEQMYSGLRDGLDLFAVCNPEKANPERNLIWADTEVNRIASLFSEGRVRILDGSDQDRATPRAVMDEAPHHSYAHFACHGVFDLIEPLKSFLSLAPNPNRPSTEKPEGEPLTLGLVLMDNSSESDEALGKDMGPLRLPRTRLVVMSACETGLVDPGDLADEYLSLPAGFLRAGAPGVVSTLWTVDDLSTALLMQRFYLYHLRGDPSSKQCRPLCPAQALRRAQQWLRDKVTAKMVAESYRQRVDALRAQEDKAFMSAQDAFFYYDQMPPDSRPFAHPVYWAPFTMSGQ